MTNLPPGFSLRPATLDDIPAMLAVIHATELAESGAVDTEAEDILRMWRASDFDPATHTLLAIAPDGQVVGYEELSDIGEGGKAHLDGYVHPKYTGLGLGTALVQAGEERIRSLMSEPQLDLRVGTSGKDERSHAMFANEGYEPVRRFQRMEIDLPEQPAAPAWPEGITVRSFVLGQDEAATHAAVTESFADHWGSVPVPLDEWVNTRVNSEGFDPTLWFLALDGDEVAGVALCRQRSEIGWVNTLGVRRPWRKRSLGLALLQHAFRELHGRGNARVGLGVDSYSLTGATRLYERAGMHVTEQYIVFGKTLKK